MLPTETKNILIAGREQRFNRSLQELLILHGYQCRLVSTSGELEKLLQTNVFSLIILNLNLVRGYGPNIFAAIESTRPAAKLIILSQDFSCEHAMLALRHGADDFFNAPYSPDDLLSCIDRIFDGKKQSLVGHHLQGQLRKSEILHRFMVNNSPDIIYLLDQEGKFSYCNRQMETVLGFSAAELAGKHFSTLVYPRDLEKSRYVFSERRTGNRAAKNIELRLIHKKHVAKSSPVGTTPVNVELHATGIYKNGTADENKYFLGTYGVLRDISERKVVEQQFYHQLYHDTLTNLPNRTLFQDRLSQALSRIERDNSMLAVMFLDIDGFKKINDTFGHACGDSLLQNFSIRLKSCLRASDTLARISGDEFVVLTPQLHHYRDVEKIAGKILDEFKSPFRMDQVEVTIGVSIGIALAPGDGAKGEELVQKADWAMYYVKHHGKHNFMRYHKNIRSADIPFRFLERSSGSVCSSP